MVRYKHLKPEKECLYYVSSLEVCTGGQLRVGLPGGTPTLIFLTRSQQILNLLKAAEDTQCSLVLNPKKAKETTADQQNPKASKKGDAWR